MASTAAAQGGLSADEKALVAFIDAHNGEAMTLLERVVNINSGTQNHAGVREVGKIFMQQLDAIGFKSEWIDGAPFKRAGHLVATHPGTGPKILLIGHLDTVFEADSPFQKMTPGEGNTAGGPGIIDMKGGDVIIVAALKALASTGALKSMNVTVVMTGDEEDSGEPLSAAREALVNAAKGTAVAIGFERSRVVTVPLCKMRSVDVLGMFMAVPSAILAPRPPTWPRRRGRWTSPRPASARARLRPSGVSRRFWPPCRCRAAGATGACRCRPA